MKVGVVLTAAVIANLSAFAAGITHMSVKSGNWSNADTWDTNGVPVHTGSETVTIKNHSIVYDGEIPQAEWYTLYLGASSGSGTARYSQTGGTLTSTYLTEVNARSKDDRTGPCIMELTDVDARMESFRLSVGRNSGNALMKMTGGSLTLDGAQLYMGIATKADAVPNRIELDHVAWTNLTSALQVGYSSVGTNIVSLKDSSLYSTKDLYLGYFTTDGLVGVGRDCLSAENSVLEFDGADVYLTRSAARHSAQLVLSNSTFKARYLRVGYVSGTTNDLAFIDCPTIQTTKAYLGEGVRTVNNVLFKDLRAPKATAQTMRATMTTYSTASTETDDNRRWYNFEYDNCDWTSTDNIVACLTHNVGSLVLRNMTLPAANLIASNGPNAPGTLVLSNVTWNVGGKSLFIGQKAGATGVARISDSTLAGSTLTICDDAANTGHDVRGDLTLDGSVATFSGMVQIRRGVGRIRLEHGAKLTCGDLYLTGITGSDGTLDIGEDSEFVATNKLFLNNQSGTRCTLTVRDGGRLSIGSRATGCQFGTSCAEFVWTMEGGEVDLGENYSASFATANGSLGVAYLNGGVVKAKGFGAPTAAGTQTVVFNGGKVQPTATGTILAANATTRVAAGGAIFNVTEGLSATVASSLAHDADAGSTDGGLVKEGAGDLVLSGANSTFNGPVRINAGTIKVSSSTALPMGAVIKIDASAGAVLTRSDKVAYPEGLSLEIVGGPLDESKRYTLVEDWSGDLPQVTGLSGNWKVVCKDGNLVASPIKGLLLMVR